MTIQEILEAHRTLASSPADKVCACDRTWRTNAEYRNHLTEVLEQHTREREAGAVRDAARYIERIFPKGLVDIRGVLADLKIAATRIGNGLHANGGYKEARDGR